MHLGRAFRMLRMHRGPYVEALELRSARGPEATGLARGVIGKNIAPEGRALTLWEVPMLVRGRCCSLTSWLTEKDDGIAENCPRNKCKRWSNGFAPKQERQLYNKKKLDGHTKELPQLKEWVYAGNQHCATEASYITQAHALLGIKVVNSWATKLRIIGGSVCVLLKEKTEEGDDALIVCERDEERVRVNVRDLCFDMCECWNIKTWGNTYASQNHNVDCYMKPTSGPSDAMRLPSASAIRVSLNRNLIHKDGDGDALFQLKSDSLPHAHAQTTKTYYKHRDSRIMKAQELKTKTSAQTLIYKIFLQRYQVYQGRLLASFQDDAKYEHVGQDTRSQGGKDDQDGRIKI
ncbi:hypothetical protein Tco_0895001 [Tanacetum coccineum]|uniref:Uncharacterized protein n=1 Tax=Tanacetum coccineum TaxID=301880 RepID=A0ABQ5CJL1_9ASTR